jgi:hypothetical protein
MNWRCVRCRTHLGPFPWHSHMDPEQWDQTDTVNCSRLLDTNLTHGWVDTFPLAQTRTYVTRLQVALVATATESPF